MIRDSSGQTRFRQNNDANGKMPHVVQVGSVIRAIYIALLLMIPFYHSKAQVCDSIGIFSPKMSEKILRRSHRILNPANENPPYYPFRFYNYKATFFHDSEYIYTVYINEWIGQMPAFNRSSKGFYPNAAFVSKELTCVWDVEGHTPTDDFMSFLIARKLVNDLIPNFGTNDSLVIGVKFRIDVKRDRIIGIKRITDKDEEDAQKLFLELRI